MLILPDELRPNVSSLHASEVGAGLNPASAHWDPLLSVALCVEVHLYGSTHWKWIHLSSEVRSLEWLLPHILRRYSTSTGTHRSLLECDPNELLLPSFWVLHQDYMKLLDGLRWTLSAPPTAAPVWRSTSFQLLLRPVYLPVTCLIWPRIRASSLQILVWTTTNLVS